MFLFFHLPALTTTLLISLIAILTLIGIMIRPFQWNEAMLAMTGAALLLLLGLIKPLDAIYTLLSDWNVFIFFLGMMALSALADAAGVFDWLAAQAARLAGGSTRRLLLNTFLLWRADLVVICSRSPGGGGPSLGPKSVGHVARFVLDHAPCP